MTERLIETDADVAEGAAWLAARVPAFRDALTKTGPLPLRRRGGGFGALLHAICGQQLSVASADAVWKRLCAADLTSPEAVLEAGEDPLRACGLSRPKMRYALALADADLDYAALATMPEQDAVETLTAVKGIGTWTAEIYLMFSVGRADVLAAGDLALQEAARDLFALPDRPSDRELRALAEAWSPWRAVAARLLWSYYRVIKNRAGISEQT
ncbi:MAG: DNA-3-methyladenine glycosylase 2 family protein [Pseudomonadota bacterium]